MFRLGFPEVVKFLRIQAPRYFVTVRFQALLRLGVFAMLYLLPESEPPTFVRTNISNVAGEFELADARGDARTCSEIQGVVLEACAQVWLLDGK